LSCIWCVPLPRAMFAVMRLLVATLFSHCDIAVAVAVSSHQQAVPVGWNMGVAVPLQPVIWLECHSSVTPVSLQGPWLCKLQLGQHCCLLPGTARRVKRLFNLSL
jgi:hypothetical protein